MTRASKRGGSTRLDRVVIVLGMTVILGAFTAGCGEGGSDASQPSTTADAVTHVPTGIWAGDDVILTVTPEGATAEFACAIGLMPRRMSVDPDGEFRAAGSYAAYAGGPVSSSDSAQQEASPAQYVGQLTDATHLTLSVDLVGSGSTYGPYHLELGADPSLERCV